MATIAERFLPCSESAESNALVLAMKSCTALCPRMLLGSSSFWGGTSKGGTRYTCSPSIRRTSRLVAST
jgi:hypothetical protein